MSVHVFFAFSQGLARPLRVPAGTKRQYVRHVEQMEEVLGLIRTRYKDNPVHWDHHKRNLSVVPDKVLCELVEKHNAWVRKAWADLAFWSKHPFQKGKGHQDTGPNKAYPSGWKSELITPKDAQQFWHGFEMLDVPQAQWTREYYVGRMNHLYEVMRGRPSEGVSLDAKALTPAQAGAVVRLFEEYLNSHDAQLEVPKGHDRLASSYDGGYVWCEKCGAVDPDDAERCPRRQCPIRAEREN